MLRSLLASGRSGVVKTFRWPTQACQNSRSTLFPTCLNLATSIPVRTVWLADCPTNATASTETVLIGWFTTPNVGCGLVFSGSTPNRTPAHIFCPSWSATRQLTPTRSVWGRPTCFLRKATALSLENHLVCRIVRSVVTCWFATPRTPPLWQHDFFLVNCSVLR